MQALRQLQSKLADALLTYGVLAKEFEAGRGKEDFTECCSSEMSLKKFGKIKELSFGGKD